MFAATQDRAVVLTTHSMEEADILGDRIAIMAKVSIYYEFTISLFIYYEFTMNLL